MPFGKNKHLKIYTLTLLLALPLLGGCNRKGIPGIGTKEITYWGLFETEEIIKPLIDSYTKDNPGVKITYEQQKYDRLSDYKQAVLTRLREGTGPCICRIHQSWVKSFAEELSPVPSSFKLEETFYPVAQQSAKVGGSYFAVPLMYDGLALFYNPAMFSEAKIEGLPKTWDEFRSAAVKLTKKDEKTGKIIQAGVAIGTGANISHASDILGLMWAQTGVAVPDDLDTQAAYDALTFYTNFVRKDHVWDETFPDSIRAFAEGKVAMIFAPSWRTYDLKGLNPTIEFKVSSVPQVPQLGDEEISDIHWASFWMEAVSKDCKAQKEAWEFLEYLTSQEGQRKFFDEAAKARLFGEPYSRVDLADSLKEDPILGPVISGAPHASSAIIAGSAGNDEVEEAVVTAIEGNLKGRSESEVLGVLKQTLQSL